jgi:hypothetical protein
VRLRIKAKNISAERHPFAAHAFHRDSLNLKHKLEQVTYLESEGGDPGQIVVVECEWPAPDLPPSQLIWKAPPHRSCKWEILEFTYGGTPIQTPGLFA